MCSYPNVSTRIYKHHEKFQIFPTIPEPILRPNLTRDRCIYESYYIILIMITTMVYSSKNTILCQLNTVENIVNYLDTGLAKIWNGRKSITKVNSLTSRRKRIPCIAILTWYDFYEATLHNLWLLLKNQLMNVHQWLILRTLNSRENCSLQRSVIMIKGLFGLT
jgi:hypothetical protein